MTLHSVLWWLVSGLALTQSPGRFTSTGSMITPRPMPTFTIPLHRNLFGYGKYDFGTHLPYRNRTAVANRRENYGLFLRSSRAASARCRTGWPYALAPF
jgi:hypothetical protein